MSRRLVCLAMMGLCLAVVPSANAVLVDINSPQAGTVVHPGSTVEYTLTITNDKAAPDIVGVTLRTVVDTNVINSGSFRLSLRPHETVTRTMQVDIPNLPLQEPKLVSIQVAAFGTISKTQSADRISFVIKPERAPVGGNGIVADLNSPQEGTVVHPGDTVNYTLTLTNDSNAPDIVRVTLWTSVDGRVINSGSFRLGLRPHQSVTRTMEVDIPADLQLAEPKLVGIHVSAFGKMSNTESVDRIGFIIAPLPPPIVTPGS